MVQGGFHMKISYMHAVYFNQVHLLLYSLITLTSALPFKNKFWWVSLCYLHAYISNDKLYLLLALN
jgi:hypothetical protein